MIQMTSTVLHHLHRRLVLLCVVSWSWYGSVMNPLAHVYGNLLIVRPPVPATCNKAGANYKSEVAHLEYFPQRAFDEWLNIVDGIVACGGDALYQFETVDEPFLDFTNLHVDGAGDIRGDDSSTVLGKLANVETGRVFAANGPWVVVDGKQLRAVMPRMLEHRRSEAQYYRDLLSAIATAAGLSLALVENPHRWEGMADVAVVGDRVVLTYAVPGHYDQATSPKSSRSSRDGVSFAADAVGVDAAARIYAELVYPHFHGDTVHFGVRAKPGHHVVGTSNKLAHYSGGLWNAGSDAVVAQLGADNVVVISADDAVEHYAGNSRQIANGVLVPDGVSVNYQRNIESLGLSTHRVPLFELFGKAGGGPACATLYLPSNLELPHSSPMRHTVSKPTAMARRSRIPQKLQISPEYFSGKTRG
jgi:hypothetical protein